MNRFEIKLGDRFVGDGHPPFIVAELSGNHNQSLERALHIIERAAKTGVDALKIQTYTADTMTLDVDSDQFRVQAPNSPWHGRRLYDLYQEAHTPWEWHQPIFRKCTEVGLVCFSTPFDKTAVDFLLAHDVPCFKVASFENTDIPLVKYIAGKGRPMIVSTGMARREELEELVNCIRGEGNDKIVLLKCTSAYPTPPEAVNLLTIPDLRKTFNCLVGISDHTLGTVVSTAAVALGAAVVEKHFTLSRAAGGVDSDFSMEPDEMRRLTEEAHQVWRSLGSVNYAPTDAEKPSLMFRRSVYVVRNIKAGEAFSEENIRVIRPGYGLAPRYYENLIGKRASCDLGVGTPMQLSYVVES